MELSGQLHATEVPPGKRLDRGMFGPQNFSRHTRLEEIPLPLPLIGTRSSNLLSDAMLTELRRILKLYYNVDTFSDYFNPLKPKV
jgi:hypothetical protein